MQANYDLEAAKIEERYDKEIEAAGENSTRGKKLEEEKQKEQYGGQSDGGRCESCTRRCAAHQHGAVAFDRNSTYRSDEE